MPLRQPRSKSADLPPYVALHAEQAVYPGTTRPVRAIPETPHTEARFDFIVRAVASIIANPNVSNAEIARRFSLNWRTVARYRSILRQHGAIPVRPARTKQPVRDHGFVKQLSDLVNSDMPTREIARTLQVSRTAVVRARREAMLARESATTFVSMSNDEPAFIGDTQEPPV